VYVIRILRTIFKVYFGLCRTDFIDKIMSENMLIIKIVENQQDCAAVSAVFCVDWLLWLSVSSSPINSSTLC
jgi:hypothetical protein